MSLVLQKLAIVLAPSGRIMSGIWSDAAGIAKHADRINQELAGSQCKPVSRTVVAQWYKGDVHRSERNEGLVSLCELIRKRIGASVTPNDFVNDSMGLVEFSEKLGIGRLEASRLIAGFMLNSEHWPGAFDFFGDYTAVIHRDPAHGIFLLDRFDPRRPNRRTSTCVLVVDEHVAWHAARRSAPFVMLVAPTGNANLPHAYYSGLMARCDDTIYLTLKAVPGPGKLNDMCQLILRPGDAAFNSRVQGFYSSMNIEGRTQPAGRILEGRRCSTSVTDAAFAAALTSCKIADLAG